MTITLDQLKGMNLQVGEPIELEFNTSISAKGEKEPENKNYTRLGYFVKITKEKFKDDGMDASRLWMTQEQGSPYPEYEKGFYMHYIEKVRRLKYAD